MGSGHMGFIEWWMDRPKWVRWGIPGVLLAVAAVLSIFGWIWWWAWGLGGGLLFANFFLGDDD